MKVRVTALTLAMLAAAACGDDGTGPGVETDGYPDIAQAVLQGFCIRGTATPPAIRAGNLATNDCTTAGTAVGFGDDSFFEGWRVRVDVAAQVTFEVDSGFDSVLDLFAINVASPDVGFGSILATDDDGTGTLDALLTYDLVPGTEYWIVVSGLDPVDVGNYTLNVN